MALLILITGVVVLGKNSVPSRLPKSTSAVFVITDRNVPPERISQALLTIYPDLDPLLEGISHATKTSAIALAEPILEHATIIVAARDRIPHLTILVKEKNNDSIRRTFEQTISATLAHLYPTERPIALPDQTRAIEQVADPSAYTFSEAHEKGTTYRTLYTKSVPTFASATKGRRLYLSSSLDDLKAMLDPAIPHLTPHRFICVIPSPGIKVYLNSTLYQATLAKLGFDQNTISRQIRQKNRLIFANTLTCS